MVLIMTVISNLSALETGTRTSEYPLRLLHISGSTHRPRTVVTSHWINCYYNGNVMYFTSSEDEVFGDFEVMITSIETGYQTVYCVTNDSPSILINLMSGIYRIKCTIGEESYEGELRIE
jgi:hypothetical protein